ncbi:MAG: tetratricopeptide repeat protein [Candidatus Krumholzibacteria bacterium]|nr:tetratricopeptide repeat protein [Candidatus Krumholzibacteria bacterium]
MITKRMDEMTGDISEEIKQMSERYSESPGSRLFAPLADAYRKSGLVDKAIELCEEGLERFPEYASAHVILGKCFYDKGATERSKDEFDRVLRLDPENMVALKFLGDIFLGENSYEEARDNYRKLLAIDPTNEVVQNIIEEMEKEFQVREIDLEKDESIKKVERPAEIATMTLAGIYASQGYYSKAVRMYRDILETEPGNEEVSRMIEKLESIMDSSEKEREETFDGEVLTISVDDVSNEIVENTSGFGGGEAETAGETGESPPKEEIHDEQKDVIDGKDKIENVDENSPEEMDHFQRWLRTMDERGGKDPGSDT